MLLPFGIRISRLCSAVRLPGYPGHSIGKLSRLSILVLSHHASAFYIGTVCLLELLNNSINLSDILFVLFHRCTYFLFVKLTRLPMSISFLVLLFHCYHSFFNSTVKPKHFDVPQV